MRVSPLMIAVALGLGLPANHVANAATAGTDAKLAVSRDGVRTYIVVLEDEPLATFRGFTSKQAGRPSLRATSPAVTGERKLNAKSLESLAYRDYLQGVRSRALADAATAIGRPLSPTFVYDVVLNGFAVSLNAVEAEKLAAVKGVKRVRPAPVRYLNTDRGPTWIGANTIWNGTASGVATKGEGVVVGIIDGGINASHDSFKAIGPADGYTHVNPRPAFLGRCTINASLCNGKLIGVWDYITDASGTSGDALDPNGHGTHTASTTAGNAVNVTYVAGSSSTPVQMSGVAPHANIIAYKVCPGNSCDGAAILAAIQRATLDQVDVINFSIGGPASDPWQFVGGGVDDDAEAFLAARAAGVTVAASAGNDGPLPGSHGNPGNAPWLMGVAMSTHDRGVANRVIGLTGGATAAPSGGILTGAGDTSAPSNTVQASLVFPADFPLCADGPNDITVSNPFTPTGASKPASWNAGTFAGKIVVCQRGTYARVAKAKNVELSGAIGMILVNSAAEGASVIADSYSIPTTHLNFVDGSALKTWLATGTGHAGRLEGTTLTGGSVFADILDPQSGRGPVVPLGVIKPDITAPGVDIIAAAPAPAGSCATSPTTCYLSLTGTSMASPHVAGSAALLAALKPTWSPTQITSALMLTANDAVRDYTGVLATPHDRGAGRVDLARAANAGLYLNITDAQFKAANASSGHTLNLPSLGFDNCFGTCGLTRTFTDMAGGGSWAISASLPAGVAMTPSVASFNIGNGANQAVTFTFDMGNAPALVGKWVYGSVTLTDTSGNNRPSLKLPVALYSSPGNIPTVFQPAGDVNLERGFFDVALSGVVALPNARYVSTDLVAPALSAGSVKRDNDNDPFNACAGAQFTPCNYDTTVTIPASPVGGPVKYRISGVSSSPTVGADIDLFMGIDTNANGPEANETLCSSGGATSDEACGLTVETTSTPQTIWIRANRYFGDTGPGSIAVNIETTSIALVAGTRRTLVATGPGHPSASTPYTLRLGYDDPSFLPGERRVGAVLLQATPGNTIADVSVVLKRSATAGFAPFALASGVARSVTLPAGAAHDKLYFQVPPNATSVTFTTAGTGTVRLDVYQVATPAGPTIPSAPVGTANGSSALAGANQTVTLTGASLPAGRYYVKPTNTGGAAATVNVTATINTANTLKVKDGSYFNPARGGHGMFVYSAASQLQLIWYTYFQDGSPTWYFVQSNAPGNNGVWNAGIYRGAWNGTTTTLTQVGDLTMTPTTTNTFNVSYNLDGQTGSEPMEAFITGCPTVNAINLDVSAHWYSPGNDGFGYSVQVRDGYEFFADFIYDGMGVPRYLLAERLAPIAAGTSVLPLDQLTGFCPTCTYVAPTRSTVGTLTRTLATNNITTIGSTATFNGGVPGSWNATFPVSKLGNTQGCAP